MMRNKLPGREASARSNIARFERLLRSVALLMLREGNSMTEVTAVMRRALAHAEESTIDSSTLMNLYVGLSALLHVWHHDPEYIDSLASPIPLSLRGPKSVEALAARVCGSVPAAEVLDSLRRQRLVRRLRNGRYLPTRSIAQLTGEGPEISGYLGRAILHFMETSETNRLDPSAIKSLVERAAIVQDLPQSEVAAFGRFTIGQGASLVSNANAWLESRRRSANGSTCNKTVTAGLHVFAFVSPSNIED
jgi:hypothetical protein